MSDSPNANPDAAPQTAATATASPAFPPEARKRLDDLRTRYPEGSKIPPKVPSAIMHAKQTREVYGDGSFGGPYRVDDGIMQEILGAALEDVLLLLKFD